MVKLKATSLIETITAMVIISIVFAIGIGSFQMVTSSQQLPYQYRVHLALEKIAFDTHHQKRFLNERIDSNTFWINKEINRYTNIDKVFIFSLTAYDNQNRQVAVRKELVVLP